MILGWPSEEDVMARNSFDLCHVPCQITLIDSAIIRLPQRPRFAAPCDLGSTAYSHIHTPLRLQVTEGVSPQRQRRLPTQATEVRLPFAPSHSTSVRTWLLRYYRPREVLPVNHGVVRRFCPSATIYVETWLLLQADRLTVSSCFVSATTPSCGLGRTGSTASCRTAAMVTAESFDVTREIKGSRLVPGHGEFWDQTGRLDICKVSSSRDRCQCLLDSCIRRHLTRMRQSPPSLGVRLTGLDYIAPRQVLSDLARQRDCPFDIQVKSIHRRPLWTLHGLGCAAQIVPPWLE